MPFSADAFLHELRCLRFGCALRLMAEVDSTIDAAREWLAEGGPEGGAVIADRQRRGRGKLHRAWAAPEGGLWLSLMARPDLEASHAGRLGVVMALAAAEAVGAVAEVNVQLKWPNDLLLDGRKLGGVLVEAEHAQGRVATAVLSLGLNANFPLRALPEELWESATTLLEATGRPHRLEAIAARLMESMERWWPSVLGDGVALAQQWRERDALWRRDIVVEAGAEAIRGEANGIDPDGALLLLAAGGERAITTGEISRVRPGSP
jgi:BirA family biotin operon repressor/biotin-[acetyl-CoA-carboxylase] ligase